MHRFRKKSETGRSDQVPFSFPTQSPETYEFIPQLPLPNDFRTSLILPDLSRRFSLLRSSSGDPVSLEDLKSRLAGQRARGAENQISEEEEDMILETLRGIRSKNTNAAERSQETIVEGNASSVRQSVQSTSTMESSLAPSSLSSSPGGRSTKRYSNNLFGSGRFRDYTYVRNATTSKHGSTRALSLTPTESSSSIRGNVSSISDLRPVTPESNSVASSTQSSPNDGVSVHSASFAPPAVNAEQTLSVAEQRIAKTIGLSAFARASLALEEAIKEIEEEAEDEIVMPRSTPIPRASLGPSSHLPDAIRNSGLSHTSVYEAGMAISSDKQVHSESEDRRASPVPSRILPGYVPGMPRPMTPRDFDSDDQRSHSTTPRATSPMIPSFAETPASSIPANIVSSLIRRDSTSSTSRQSPRPISPASPLFLQRSTNGRYTPDEGGRDNSATEFDSPLNSSILTRRRPASPLSGPPYQPMAVSSRPGTPSNIVWTTNSYTSQKAADHSRNGSYVSDGGVSNSDIQGVVGRHNQSARSLRSPALPDSPIERGYESMRSLSPTISDPNGLIYENRSASKISNLDLASPIRTNRSPTPTQNASRSPTSPAFSDFGISSRNGSRRSSKQNAPSSPFHLGPITPVVFSPLVNSSRSSLESAGSSYHSWDGEKDRYLSLFNDIDVQQPAWHDLSSSDKSSSATPGGSPNGDWDAEDIIARYAGLKKSDFLAIQEKLVGVARASISEGRDRAGSVRRRRPSTSQSNYSVNGREHRVASPLQTQTPAPSGSSPSKTDQHSKASALLNSVVDSIQSTRDQTSSLNTTAAISPSLTDKDISPTSRRNRDLAQALFGREEAEHKIQPTKPPKPESGPQDISGQVVNFSRTNLASETDANSPSPSTAPYLLSRNPSAPRIPHTPQEEADLAREVRQKTDAAMLALKKPPLNTNSSRDLVGRTGSISRKRISPHQISTPRLVSASTSVDTIPLPRTASLASASNSGPSRIGSRFKKLRGTLRAKNPLPNGEEVTPYLLDAPSPPAVQTAHYDPASLRALGGSGPASATEAGRFKVPVPSPPASAGPGLKGFIALFRGKQRMTETASESEPRRSLQTSPSPLPTSSQSGRTLPVTLPLSKANDAGSSPPALRPDPPARSAPAAPSLLQEHAGPIDSDESTALKQLFDAATNLGLDQGALNDLLARSTSTSSRSTEWTLLTRNNSSVIPETRDNTTVDGSRSVGRPSVDDQTMRAGTPDRKETDRTNGRSNADDQRNRSVSRQASVRKQADHIRRPRDGQSENRAASAVIRRTIIFPSEARSSPIDLNALVRKGSSRRRRASITSTSSRSVHDRAPTPPPPRSPTGKRFSNGPSPPVPHLPPSLLSQVDNLLSVTSTPVGGPIEKSNSTYDSLYEMYAGENKIANSTVNDRNNPDNMQNQGDLLPTSESGPALEVIELANGETIWSIVNGLRDDDEESIYTGRTSVASEYSTREGNGENGVQVFVKEHGRSGSKGSTSSFLSRKKGVPGKQRPDTKVFYSSSAQIGRLIENLSQGMEAGSFNILPNRAPGHSASSSLSTNDIHWTVEERLEHMLGSMRTP